MPGILSEGSRIADSTKCEEIREVKKSGGLFRKRTAGQDWHGESARLKAAPTRRKGADPACSRQAEGRAPQNQVGILKKK